MTPRGLIKLTAIANNIEAWKEWDRLAADATRLGYSYIAARNAPPNEAGWRKVDKCSAALRKELQAALDKEHNA